MEVDYTQQLEAVNAKLDSIYASVAHIDETLSSLANDSGIRIDDSALSVKLDEIFEALNGVNAEGFDYTQQFERLSQLLVYTDMLLIVLVVFLVVGVGAFVGAQVTKQMRLK